ncbi:hypothetical protein DAEQUDRAFT_773773 [Daedalea quercina L-15889]|uniref:FAD binding domain-containing protein n=1 Tax=Daedalea quercina L-15889 TaxID=1314783 RepID=A0A165LD15_9APHY|nr:hypothetical protein DAEQUDRAFT_773773 [Daedalea quercina L-15889]
MSNNPDTDVLIVGAGPAGLVAALALSHHGIAVKIVDRRITGETAGQADGIQSRMMEIWDSLGIGAELRELSSQIHRMVIYEPNHDGSGIKQSSQCHNISVPSARYPFESIAASHVIEGILLRALAAQGITVERPVVPESLKIIREGGITVSPYVEVTVTRLNDEFIRDNNIRQAHRSKLVETAEAVKERRVIRTKYVLGCDGAHSWVRKAVNLTLEGDASDLVWGVVDFTPDTDFPTTRAKNLIGSPLSGGIAWIPRPNNTARAYIRLQTEARTVASDETQDKSASRDSQRNIIQSVERAFLPYSMRLTNVTWCNEYRVGQRVAPKFSAAGRVFLLGDACRTHSPNAGQGANNAMYDAYNLAWKLAYVLQGRASADILDTYEAERRTHALELIQFDKDLFEIFKPVQFGAGSYHDIWEYKSMFLCGVGLKYNSRLTISDAADIAPGLRIGERAPCADIIQYSDWTQWNTLDLMVYNGHFRLILLPGDTRVLPAARSFDAFYEDLVASLSKNTLSFLDILTILNIPKETPCDNLHPPPILRPLTVPGRLYVDECGRDEGQRNGGLYESLKIRPDGGAAILVRPDGIVAMATGVHTGDADRIAKYFARRLLADKATEHTGLKHKL